ncbi:MAG TPA: extracellular solute-binding protein [Spirochaetales bacterium]|nr:extracellular solute-binding protein [Spirochaetales bacterium]
MKKGTIMVLVLLLVSIPLLFSAGAKEEKGGKLVVWSAAAEDEAEALVKAFKAHHPTVDVEIIRAGSSELLTRLQAEQPSPGGDILLGIAQESFDANMDKFVGYKTSHHGEIPDGLKDANDPPKYYGFSMPLQVFIVNKNMMKEADWPRKWIDLTNEKYKGEIIMANPALSGSAYAQIYTIYQLYGMEALEKLAKIATFVASSTAVPESVARGEYAIGVTGENNVAEQIKKGAPVTAIYPEDGTGARFDATGIIARGPNPETAKLFMEFITSEEAYNIILKTRSRRTVNPKLPGPENLPSLSQIKLIKYDATHAGQIRNELTQKFSEFIR